MNREDRQVSATPKGIGFGLTLGCVRIPSSPCEPTCNPRHLNAARISPVDEICQTLTGLRPSDALPDNLWPGNQDRGSATDGYRRGVASLSVTVRSWPRSPLSLRW